MGAPNSASFGYHVTDMKTIAITIDEAMLESVDRLAVGSGDVPPNRSKIVRAAVGEYLARVEQTVQEERERAVFRRHRERLARQAAALVKDQAKA